MRQYQQYSSGSANAMRQWTKIVNPWRATWNFIVIWICRYSPSLSFKHWCYRRLLGMRVGPGASVGLMVMMDVFFPEMISIGADSTIGYNSTILCHEFLQKEYRLGQVKIGTGVLVGANTTILPGVTIGDGAVVSACSLVNRDVPPGVMVGGVPIRVLRAGESQESGIRNQESGELGQGMEPPGSSTE